MFFRGSRYEHDRRGRARRTKDGRTIRYKRMRFMPQAPRSRASSPKCARATGRTSLHFGRSAIPSSSGGLCDLNLVRRPVDLTALPGRPRRNSLSGRRRLTWASCRPGSPFRSAFAPLPVPFFQALREIEVETSVGRASIFRLHFDLSRTIFGDFDALAIDIFRPLAAGHDQRRGRPRRSRRL